MATRSSILAWRIPWTEEPGCVWGGSGGGRFRPGGRTESDKTEATESRHRKPITRMLEKLLPKEKLYHQLWQCK